MKSLWFVCHEVRFITLKFHTLVGVLFFLVFLKFVRDLRDLRHLRDFRDFRDLKDLRDLRDLRDNTLFKMIGRAFFKI